MVRTGRRPTPHTGHQGIRLPQPVPRRLTSISGVVSCAPTSPQSPNSFDISPIVHYTEHYTVVTRDSGSDPVHRDGTGEWRKEKEDEDHD